MLGLRIFQMRQKERSHAGGRRNGSQKCQSASCRWRIVPLHQCFLTPTILACNPLSACMTNLRKMASLLRDLLVVGITSEIQT